VGNIRRRDIAHHRDQHAGTAIRRTGAIAVYEEHETAGLAIQLSERRLVAVRQAGRRVRIQHEYAADELPLVRRQFDPFAVMRFDGVLGTDTSCNAPATSPPPPAP